MKNKGRKAIVCSLKTVKKNLRLDKTSSIIDLQRPSVFHLEMLMPLNSRATKKLENQSNGPTKTQRTSLPRAGKLR